MSKATLYVDGIAVMELESFTIETDPGIDVPPGDIWPGIHIPSATMTGTFTGGLWWVDRRAKRHEKLRHHKRMRAARRFTGGRTWTNLQFERRGG